MTLKSRPLLPVVCLILASGCSLNPSLRLAEVAPSVTRTQLSEVPFHPQQAHHCGPSSLLSVLEAAGTNVDYQQIVDRVYVPGLEGSLQVEMLAAARSFGHVAYTVAPEPEAVLAEVEAGRPVLVLLNLGLPKKPIWHYAVVVGFDPASNQMLLHSARTAYSTQMAPAWLRRWDWAGRWGMVLLQPGEWPAAPERERLLRALAAFEEGASVADAEVVWRTASYHWPEEPITWLGLGNALQSQGRGSDAQVAYRRALKIDAQHLPARLNLAQSLSEHGETCAALDVLGTAPAADHPLSAPFGEMKTRIAEQCRR